VVQDTASALEGNLAASALRSSAYELRGGHILHGQSERFEYDDITGGTAAGRSAEDDFPQFGGDVTLGPEAVTNSLYDVACFQPQ